MKKKCLIVFSAAMLAGGTRGMDWMEFLNECFSSVTVTSTEITLSFPRSPLRVWEKGIDRRFGQKDEIVFTPDGEVKFSDMHHVVLIFTPVSYKSKEKGFRLTCISDGRSFNAGMRTNNMYFALSDEPVKVGEEDVEMIMDGERNKFGIFCGEGRWVKFGGGPPATPRNVPYLWLGLGIILCVLAALFAVRKKRT